jgi:N-glycosylase/DNA lyase
MSGSKRRVSTRLAAAKQEVITPDPILSTESIKRQGKNVITLDPMLFAESSKRQGKNVVTPDPILSTESIKRQGKNVITLHPILSAKSAEWQYKNVVTPDPILSTEAPSTPKKLRSPIKLEGLSTPVESPAGGKSSSLLSDEVAKIAPDRMFQDLCVSPAELRPSATLTTGQCFHWRVVDTSGSNEGDEIESKPTESKVSAWGSHDATEWVGTLRISSSGQSIVLVIRETPDTTMYRVLEAPTDFNVEKFLHSYFQLDEKLVPLYREWSDSCDRLSRIAPCIPGVRIVDQDPWECLVSFICSSNNNIPRIAKMVGALRREYGEPLVTIGDEVLYSFPSLDTLLARANDKDLRSKCGLGYRSKYLLETMRILESLGGEEYLWELRSIEDPVVVQDKLVQFCGVGRKVADCVALFSLKQDNSIPVDVHVWNIARRDYDTERLLEKIKSLTPAAYRQVGDLFRHRFKTKSGWAHSLLFVAELPSFRPTLPKEVILEMEKVSH